MGGREKRAHVMMLQQRFTSSTSVGVCDDLRNVNVDPSLAAWLWCWVRISEPKVTFAALLLFYPAAVLTCLKKRLNEFLPFLS